ncbi:uncharacterized protein Dvir_GJ26590, partial [Drosophila virilis]
PRYTHRCHISDFPSRVHILHRDVGNDVYGSHSHSPGAFTMRVDRSRLLMMSCSSSSSSGSGSCGQGRQSGSEPHSVINRPTGI